MPLSPTLERHESASQANWMDAAIGRPAKAGGERDTLSLSGAVECVADGGLRAEVSMQGQQMASNCCRSGVK